MPSYYYVCQRFLKGDLEPDLSFVIKTLDSLMPFVKKGQIISLESTTSILVQQMRKSYQD